MKNNNNTVIRTNNNVNYISPISIISYLNANSAKKDILKENKDKAGV